MSDHTMASNIPNFVQIDPTFHSVPLSRITVAASHTIMFFHTAAGASR